MSRLLSTLATIWRLAHPYFCSEDRRAGRLLLAAVIAIELSMVGINVLLNHWNARFYNALQERNWDTFVSELLYFCVLAAVFIALAVYQLYLNQWLQIRWRRWMTQQYLGHWLDGANHYRMQLLGDAADNPDQRIAEDIQMFVERTLVLGIGLLGAVVTLVLVRGDPVGAVGGGAAQSVRRTESRFPGYLVWAALIYAVVGTVLTHLVGRPLVALNFRQQRFEADFRFNLVRVRENSEQIALLGGEKARNATACSIASAASSPTGSLIMKRTKQLTFLTAGYKQISVIFPFVVVSPAYFAGAVQLGGLMQTASAFTSVQTSLSFFITVYRQIGGVAGGGGAARRLRRRGRARRSAAASAKPAIEVVARRRPATRSRSTTCWCGCRTARRW